jgi:4-hydroxybenzoate polyprenyltransferase
VRRDALAWIVRSLFLSSRAFPYGRYLITIFPIYAVLVDSGRAASVWSLALIAPFVLAMAAGFIYNTICDAASDPKEKNPITRGELDRGVANVAVLFLATLAILLSVLLFEQWLSRLIFFAYVLLWLSYSGLGIRFKKSLIGPIVASFLLFSGPPVILLVEHRYLTYPLELLLLGILIVFTGHEIKHTVVEHEMDSNFRSKTYATILGKKRAEITEYVSLAVGFSILLSSVSYLRDGVFDFIGLIATLFAISLASTIWYGFRVKFDVRRDVLFVTMPYISTKVFLIAYGLVVLSLPPILSLFVIWIYLIDRYP